MATRLPPASLAAARHLVRLAVALGLAACAAAPVPPVPPPGGSPPVPLAESQAALARPEGDPACRATVQAPLAALGLAQVTVKLEYGPGPGEGLRLVEVLAPELTPAGKQALATAFASCPWRPTVDASGRAETWTETYLRTGR